MQYKSDAQRKWAHTEDGTKALGSKEVSILDKASKGKKLPKKVTKEAMSKEEPLDDIQFWVVITPTSPNSAVQNIMTSVNPFQFCELHKNGLAPDRVAGFYMDEVEAGKKAQQLIDDVRNTAQALEEKKEEVSSKLQKAIDALQKKAEEHMKMMKSEPENADKHHEQAEKAMARIKELRGKHTSVEKSKKPLEPLEEKKK